MGGRVGEIRFGWLKSFPKIQQEKNKINFREEFFFLAWEINFIDFEV